jgi:hypothetical protein
MWHRAGLVSGSWAPLLGSSWGLLVAVLAAACSSDPADSESPEPGGEMEPGSETSGAAVQFAIDGRSEPLGAQARLDVQQGSEFVHLGITGADSGSDVVVFDIYFAGVDSTMGEHMLPLGLPVAVGEGNYANVSLDGETYYSQGGQVELSLVADGSIDGRFEVNLAHDQTVEGSPLLPPAPSDDAMMLTGSFEGSWILICQSRFPGHETLMQGGAFCDDLEF